MTRALASFRNARDEDVSSFRKLFGRHVGMTPREYRSRFAERAAASNNLPT